MSYLHCLLLSDHQPSQLAFTNFYYILPLFDTTHGITPARSLTTGCHCISERKIGHEDPEDAGKVVDEVEVQGRHVVVGSVPDGGVRDSDQVHDRYTWM